MGLKKSTLGKWTQHFREKFPFKERVPAQEIPSDRPPQHKGGEEDIEGSIELEYIPQNNTTLLSSLNPTNTQEEDENYSINNDSNPVQLEGGEYIATDQPLVGEETREFFTNENLQHQARTLTPSYSTSEEQ